MPGSVELWVYEHAGSQTLITRIICTRAQKYRFGRRNAHAQIDVDLGPAGLGAVDFVEPSIRGLAALGLRVPSPVRCLNLGEQVAQKLHACTGPYSQGRARDVLDILLIDLLGKLDVRAVSAAAEQVFTQRATHDFPPPIQIPAEWKPALEVLAKELGYPATSAAEIEARFRIERGTIDFLNARKVSISVLEEHRNRYTLRDGKFVIGKIGTIGEPFFTAEPFHLHAQLTSSTASSPRWMN
jgi:hypothetical protein